MDEGAPTQVFDVGRHKVLGDSHPGASPPYGSKVNYDIVMKPLFEGLQKISIETVKTLSDHPWFNRTLCGVNGSVVRLGVFNGEFHWHAHPNEDEFFLVLEGALEIEIEGRASAKLGPMEGVMIPRGVQHRPKAPNGAVVLMVEQSTIVPTGS